MSSHFLEFYQNNEIDSFSLESDAARQMLRSCMPKSLNLPVFDHLDCITSIELSSDGLIMCVVSVDKMITIWRRNTCWDNWVKQQKFKVNFYFFLVFR